MTMPHPGVTRNPRYHADDIAELFGNGGTVKILYETADANANALIFVAPAGGAVDVPVFIFGDVSIENVDLGAWNAITEPTIVVYNNAADAYIAIDAGDEPSNSRGIYFKSAADEDIEIFNLSPTGAPRVYWDESEDQVHSTKGWVFDAACDVQGTWVATAAWTLPALTLGGTVTVNGQTFDDGAVDIVFLSSGAGTGIEINNTAAGDTGARLTIYTNSASPAVNDDIGQVSFTGEDSASVKTEYGAMRCRITNVTATTRQAQYLWYLMDADAGNLVLQLTGPGVLSADLAGTGTAAQMDLFDDYDDALVLKQTIQQRNRELGEKLGLFYRKDTGSGWMMNFQPMIKLLAGAAYQTRQTLDELKARLDVIEQRQNRLLQGG